MALTAALILAALLSGGCSRARPEIIPHKTMVMNFATPPDYKAGFTLHGWWFTSRDHRRNENIGILFADQLARALAPLPEVDVYPRLDLRYYLDAKRKSLDAAYPNLTEEQRDRLFGEIPPLTFARDRGCDVLVVGDIFDSYVVHHRTIHWWQGVLRGEVRFLDVRTGEELARYQFSERDNFKSQMAMCEKVAARIARKLHKSRLLR